MRLRHASSRFGAFPSSRSIHSAFVIGWCRRLARSANATAPLPFGGIASRSQARSNSRRYLCLSQRMTGPDVTPRRLRNRRSVPAPISSIRAKFGTGRAQRRVGGGVLARLCEHVAPVSQAVSPQAQSQRGEYGNSPQSPAHAHQCACVITYGETFDFLDISDPLICAADLANALGYVFRDVRCHRAICDCGLTSPGENGTHVGFSAPPDGMLAQLHGVGSMGLSRLYSAPHNLRQQPRGSPCGRWRMRPVRTVDPDYSVHVDRTALLEFCDFRKGEPQMCVQISLGYGLSGSEATPDQNAGPIPEFTGRSVPENVCCIVVAGQANGLTNSPIRVVMTSAAANRTAMRALPTGTTRTTRRIRAGSMDRAEAGRRQRHEQPGMTNYRGGHGLAAQQPGPDQVEGIPGVEP